MILVSLGIAFIITAGVVFTNQTNIDITRFVRHCLPMLRTRNAKIQIRISQKAAKEIEEISARTRTLKSEIAAAALEFALPKILSGEMNLLNHPLKNQAGPLSLFGPSPESE